MAVNRIDGGIGGGDTERINCGCADGERCGDTIPEKDRACVPGAGIIKLYINVYNGWIPVAAYRYRGIPADRKTGCQGMVFIVGGKIQCVRNINTGGDLLGPGDYDGVAGGLSRPEPLSAVSAAAAGRAVMEKRVNSVRISANSRFIKIPLFSRFLRFAKCA